jgi:hypothetical protein
MASPEQCEQSVKEFADAARRFCAWAESEPDDSEADLITAQRLLAELHLAAIRLPALDPDRDREANRLPAEMWERMRQRFANLPVDGYWDVFDPLKEEKPVFGSLSDDLADIYRDIKTYMPLYEAGRIEEAVFQWRLHFYIHGGHHLVGAQRAVHCFLTDRMRV